MGANVRPLSSVGRTTSLQVEIKFTGQGLSWIKITSIVNGCASLMKVELDDLNKDLVAQMDPQYSEHAPGFEKIPKPKKLLPCYHHEVLLNRKLSYYFF